jgi:hypothetical protein
MEIPQNRRVTIVTPLCYTPGVKTLTIRDLRTRPREAQKTLADEGEALLTSNGKPVALMLRVDASTLQETLDTLRRAKGLQALRAIRRRARERGLDRLGIREIDAIVARTRNEKRRRLHE